MKESYKMESYHWQDRGGKTIYSAYDGATWGYVHSLSSSWGYTLWREGICIGGAQNYQWTFHDALAHADTALLEAVRAHSEELARLAQAEMEAAHALEIKEAEKAFQEGAV